MTKLFHIFRRPHPFQLDRSSIVLPSVLVFLVLLLLTPFGFMRSSWLWRGGFALLFGGITALSIVGVVGLWRRLGWLEEEEWTIGKEVLLHLQIVTTIALLNVLVFWGIWMQGLGYGTWTLSQVAWKVGLGTWCISILPVGGLIVYEHLHRQRLQLQTVRALNARLTQALEEATAEASAAPIHLQSEQGKPVLQVLPEELLLVQSDGNYVEVFYRQDALPLQRILIRNRLKNILAQLPESPFFHCHKRYIINVQQVVQVQGNARNLEVLLRGYDTPIPISRSKTQALTALMEAS